MNKVKALIGGIGLGAGAMYFLDPDRGKRRRADAGNKVRHLVNKTDDAIGKTSRDLANRFSGVIAEASSLLLPGGEVSNEVLVARVRSKLGRVVSHPSPIEVAAEDGRVILRGPVLKNEKDHLLERVAAVKGVSSVDDKLQVYDAPGNVAGLQGGRIQLGERSAFTQTNWSPTTRFLAGVAGGAIAAYAAKRRGLVGASLGPVGLGLLSRAVTNLAIKRIVGLETGPRTIDIAKTINIAAPVEDVFKFWAHHQNFPQFMSRVREVKKIDERKYHWVVAGPAGVSVEWDAEITKLVPNQFIAFNSLPGSAVEQIGRIHFTPTSDGDTCVDIKMSYNPPAGAIGHLVALLLGADPKNEMDEDLKRMKSYIETGQVPHDAVQKKSLAHVGE